MVIFYPMMFFSGTTVPMQILPAGIKRIAHLLPLTYVVSLLQGVWFGEGPHEALDGNSRAVRGAGGWHRALREALPLGVSPAFGGES